MLTNEYTASAGELFTAEKGKGACLNGKPIRVTDHGRLSDCVGLLELKRQHKHMTIRLIPTEGKADLTQSRTMQLLAAAKENDPR